MQTPLGQTMNQHRRATATCSTIGRPSHRADVPDAAGPEEPLPSERAPQAPQAPDGERHKTPWSGGAETPADPAYFPGHSWSGRDRLIFSVSARRRRLHLRYPRLHR